jgi:hypothetical protein
MNLTDQTRNGCIALAQIGREHIRKLSEAYGPRAQDVVAREEPFVSIQAAIDLLEDLTRTALLYDLTRTHAGAPPIAHVGRPDPTWSAGANLGSPEGFRLDQMPSEPPTGVEGRRLAPDATPSPSEGTDEP